MRASRVSLWGAGSMLAVIVAAGLPAQAGGSPPSGAPGRALSPRVVQALGPAGQLRGMVLNDLDSVERGLLVDAAQLARLAKEGVTSVTAYVYLYLDSPTATQVTSGEFTPTDTEISLLASAARAEGLGLHLMPVLLNRGEYAWRGNYLPADRAAFFASYTGQVVHYATLAELNDVSMFYVGSENRLIQGPSYNTYWRALITEVRKHYSGALTYLSTSREAVSVPFWSALDLAAISPYFSMGTDPLPTYERSVAAWRTVHLPFVARVVKRLKMPLVYGEVGFNSQKGSFARPEMPAKQVGTPAPAAQADAYRALLDMLVESPGVYGVTWFRWSAGTTVADMGYSPAGKPAECVLAAYWSADATVRQVAGLPVCDLNALDTALAAMPLPAGQRAPVGRS